jgi:hypothetical protein
VHRALVVAVACVAAVVIVGIALVGVLVLTGDDGPAEAVRAPDAPSDLCAVIGVDHLAEWVPDADDGNDHNTEATCQVDTASGTTEDLEYGSLYARVYRYGSIGDVDAEAQAVEQIAQQCASALEGDAGLGDASCVEYAEEAVDSGRAAVSVRAGADLVSVSYYASPLSADEARRRTVDAAAAIVARLRR